MGIDANTFEPCDLEVVSRLLVKRFVQTYRLGGVLRLITVSLVSVPLLPTWSVSSLKPSTERQVNVIARELVDAVTVTFDRRLFKVDTIDVVL
eukprot:49245-Eustigmatos_ZCMA.PRE.1